MIQQCNDIVTVYLMKKKMFEFHRQCYNEVYWIQNGPNKNDEYYLRSKSEQLLPLPR